MSETIDVTLADGSTVDLSTFAQTTLATIAALQEALSALQTTVTGMNTSFEADIVADQASLTALQDAFAAWAASKGGTSSTGSTGTATGSTTTAPPATRTPPATIGSGSTTTAPAAVLQVTKVTTSNNDTAIWFHGAFVANSVTSIDASLDGGVTWPFTGKIGNEGGGWDTWWYNAPGGTWTPMVRATADHSLTFTSPNTVTIVAAAATTTTSSTASSPTSTSTGTTTVPGGTKLAITFTPAAVTAGNAEAQSIGTPLATGLVGTASWALTGTTVLTVDAATGALTVPANAVAALITGTLTVTDSSTSDTATLALSIPIMPTGNPENLTLSIGTGNFTFSNIPPGDNTICVVGATNCKVQYPSWAILKSSVPLTIDYAGYVHCMVAPGDGPITATVQCIDFTGNSVATEEISVPVVQVGQQTPVRATRAFGDLPTTGLVANNTFLSGATGSIVGFNIFNPTLDDAAVGYSRFVQPFASGAVPKGETVALIAPGAIRPMQVDPVNTYPDGSLRTAILTVQHDALGTMLSDDFLLATAHDAESLAINLATALTQAKYALGFTIQMLNNDGTVDGTPITVDLVAAMQAALTAGKASYFREGPLVTEARVVVPVSGSLYLNVDLAAYSDGSIAADLAVRNDIAMSATGGPIYTTGSITQNGETVYSWSQLYQTQYQAWFYQCGTAPMDCCNVELDPAYLTAAAVMQPYKLTNGEDAATIVGYLGGMTEAAGWLRPLNVNNVDVGMPGTGGRPDIGYETQSATIAMMTQDPRAIDYCCGQAEASGSAPWNMYDMANGCWISTANYPDLWSDNRANTGTPGDATSNGLTQKQTSTPQNWALDQAHMPDLAFVPWLYTGRRMYLDQVLAQGAWSVVCQYARAMTIPGTTTVVQQSAWGSQVRGIAWMLRQISNAGLFAPDNTSYATYFAEIMEQNATYGTGMQAYLQSIQGNCYGYLAQDHGVNNFAPWEQNYLQPICALAGARGYPGFTGIANWFARFTVESFLAQTDGPYKGANWQPCNGGSYELFLGATDAAARAGGTALVGTPAQTFAEMEYWTVRGGQSNAGETYDATTDTISGPTTTPSWAHSQGDYGQLCAAVLAWAIRNGIPNAAAAAAFVASDGVPFVDLADYEKDPTFSLAA